MKKEDHILIQKVAEGAVTRKEFDGFQERLRHEPGLVESYRSYALLHHTLTEEFEGMPVRRMASRSSGNFWQVAGGLAAAAALVFAAAVLWMQRAEKPAVAAVPSSVEFSEDAIWTSTGDGGDIAGVWTLEDGSELNLSQGRAKILLSDKALAVIEGPAELRMDDAENIYLKQGRGFFRLLDKDADLSVRTPSLKAMDLGTAFEVVVDRVKPDEVRVLEGKVRLEVAAGGLRSDLAAGDGARVDSEAKVERFAVERNDVPQDLGRAETVVSGILDGDDWTVAEGAPEFRYGVVSGAGFEVFRDVPELEALDGSAVVLATLEVADPEQGEFHTADWAGLSFFSGGEEIMFFGDSHGDERTWSMDLKQGEPVVLPDEFRPGARSVTMRYEVATGKATLHEGGLPLAEPFCTGRLAKGLRFDSVRIGASEGASIAVKKVELRIIR